METDSSTSLCVHGKLSSDLNKIKKASHARCKLGISIDKKHVLIKLPRLRHLRGGTSRKFIC